jgi:hypothetical protein
MFGISSAGAIPAIVLHQRHKMQVHHVIEGGSGRAALYRGCLPNSTDGRVFQS